MITSSVLNREKKTAATGINIPNNNPMTLLSSVTTTLGAISVHRTRTDDDDTVFL